MAPTAVPAAMVDAAREFLALPNVGPATVRDFLRLGIRDVADLATRDADDLYARICARDGARHDPCVRDVYAAAIDAARGLPTRPWWHYSRERIAKEHAAKNAQRVDDWGWELRVRAVRS